jgi:predicted outer membrane lipoprotein
MARDTDLFPWILGGCLACAAGAMTMVAVSAPEEPGGRALAASPPAASTSPIASPSPQSGSFASSVPASSAAARATQTSSSDQTTALSPVVISPNARPQLPPGQVWECDVNGQRVFSDVQCGSRATVRQLRDLNVMDSPAAPQPFGYGGPYPGYRYPPATSPAPPVYYPDEAPADYSGDPYVGDSYIVVHDRYRRYHRPHAQPHPRSHG